MGTADGGDGDEVVVMVAMRAGIEKENSGRGRRNGGNGRCMTVGSGGRTVGGKGWGCMTRSFWDG